MLEKAPHDWCRRRALRAGGGTGRGCWRLATPTRFSLVVAVRPLSPSAAVTVPCLSPPWGLGSTLAQPPKALEARLGGANLARGQRVTGRVPREQAGGRVGSEGCSR